jgi:Ca2+-binding RTX toxin-like protein
MVSAHDPFSVPPPPSDDLLDGGAGVDTATYVDRRIPVVADLQRGLGGQRGERDRLSGIENLVGGRGRDVLRGDAGDNRLSASQFVSNPRAGDVLAGRDGDDLLETTSDRTRLDGGRGDDMLDSNHHRHDVRCGPGMDRLWDIAPGMLVRRDCDWVEVGLRYSPVTTRGGQAFIRIEIRRPISWCAGTIALRSPRGRLSRRVRWETGRGRAFRRRLRLSLPLTPAGRRAAAAHRVATIHARDRCTDARGRWRMPL